MTGARPLAVCGEYAPSVLYAASRWRPEGMERRVFQRLKAYALLGVLEGIHTVRLGGRSWRLGPGGLAILPPDESWDHRMAPRSRLLYAVVTAMRCVQVGLGDNNTRRIHPDEPSQPKPEAIWGVGLPIVQPAAVAEPSLIELRAVCDLWWRGDLHRMRANHLVGSILLRAVSAVAAPAVGTEPERSEDPVVDRALAGLAGIPPPPTATAWAVIAGLHRNRFKERFAAAMGMAPAAFLRQYRLRRAEEMLLAGRGPLDLVAIESGYRDVRAMAHAFAVAHGCAPTVWLRTRQARS
jgi:AraC-like DNA-binding protein